MTLYNKTDLPFYNTTRNITDEVKEKSLYFRVVVEDRTVIAYEPNFLEFREYREAADKAVELAVSVKVLWGAKEPVITPRGISAPRVPLEVERAVIKAGE